MPSDSRLNDCHDYSQNWVMAARPLGVCNRYVFWQPVVIYLDEEYFHSFEEGRVALFPQLIYKEPQGTMTEPNQLQIGTTVDLTEKWGVASRAYPFPIYQTVIYSCWGFGFLIFILSLYFCIRIINCIVSHVWSVKMSTNGHLTFRKNISFKNVTHRIGNCTTRL